MQELNIAYFLYYPENVVVGCRVPTESEEVWKKFGRFPVWKSLEKVFLICSYGKRK